jgi:hypothetical protein
VVIIGVKYGIEIPRPSQSVVKRELNWLPIGPPYSSSQVERTGTGDT